MWKALEETLVQHPSGAKLKALYAGVTLGEVPRETILKYLKFDNRDAEYHAESFEIAMSFADYESFRPVLRDVMRQISQTRNNTLYDILLSKMDVAFPILFEDDPRTTLYMVESALRPINKNSCKLALRFLQSVPKETLLMYPRNFNFNAIIRKALEYGDLSYLESLKVLMKKVDYRINKFELDWFGDECLLSLELCKNIEPGVLIDLLTFQAIPVHAVPRIVGHLRDACAIDFYPVAHDTLFLLAMNSGCGNVRLVGDEGFEMVVEKSFMSNSEIRKLVQTVSSPFDSCSLGIIMGSLLSYLDAAYDFTQHSAAEKFSLLVMARFLAPIFPKSAVSLMRKILKANDMPVGVKMATDMFKDFVPESAAGEYAKFALDQFGVESATSLCPDVCIKACVSNYHLASLFAPFLHQPLPLLPTFLAFSKIKEHEEWVEKCRSEIPETKWILTDGNDQKQKQAVSHDRGDEEEDQPEYKFRRPRPPKGLPGVFDGSRYALISYFTHYNMNSKPSEITGATIEEIEQYVFENAKDDIRLVIGFFFYAIKKHFQTQRVQEWTTKLQSMRTEAEMYAVSLFLTSLRMNLSELPPFMTEFIEKHLLFLGYTSLSKFALNYAFQVEHGMEWFFIRSVISMDPTFMSEYPLVLAEFAEKQSLFKVYEQFFNSVNHQKETNQLYFCFVSLISVLFRPQKVIQHRFWPIAHRCLYSLPVTPTISPAVKVDPRIVQGLVACLQQQRYFPSQFFAFFFQISIDRQFMRPIQELLKPKTPQAEAYFVNLLPSTYFLNRIERGEEVVLDENSLNFYENRPPSFALAFYRSLMGIFAPPLPQFLISQVENILCPVFPPFGYIGLKVWDNVMDDTKILSGELCEDPVSVLFHVGRTAISLYNALMTNPNFRARTEATDALVKIALSERTSILFAVGAADATAKYQNQIEEIVSAPGFVDNAENHLNAVLFAARIAKKLEKAELLDVVKENTKNSDKNLLFSALTNREAMKEVLEYA